MTTKVRWPLHVDPRLVITGLVISIDLGIEWEFNLIDAFNTHKL